ncbi:MAG: NAD(P)-binding domain-containing protein [Chloroflexi bacterium]|nr:NAD(P)-binding domain-containing protein [Chloroflexota bacterium]
MTEKLDTIIIGGGQAGLSLSYLLTQQGREHLVLEKAGRAGEAWRWRWDSFTFVTPNWAIRLPGGNYQGDNPDGYMPRDEIIGMFEAYVTRHGLPVRYGVAVKAVKRTETGYTVEADGTTWEAANVVVATGSFQKPKSPSFSANIAKDVLQIHSGEYRNPSALPPGAVLIIGSGQSGCQIAEELYQSGRKVFLSVGSAGRAPRRYRGKDVFWWLDKSGFFDRTLDKLPSPKARFAGNPQASGTRGGHPINLHQFARDGVTLLGRVQGADDHRIALAPNLKEALGKVDEFEVNLLKMIDGFIAKSGLDAPKEEAPQLRDGYETEVITELDLRAAGVSSIIWAMGYTFDFSLVQLPIFDDDGYPVQQRGVTDYPGLYFLGLHWLHTAKSTLLLGVGEDAAYVAEHIATRGQ